ncbi:MAG: 2-C-methyl-D-erythritol 4-phosphate cytidylyltransferase [Vampirovibrionales bacterium]|nr:2-C-methyl-D-erythritol 4-phosphate cytidylyltransferase [Vampirovibrionales bacterium]
MIPSQQQANAWALIAAGGTGSRFSAESDKLFALLAGEAVLSRTLKALLAARRIEGVVIAARPQRHTAIQALLDAIASVKPVIITPGGDTRRESVLNALRALPPAATIVAVHDAARPLIRPARIDAAIESLQTRQVQGVVVAIDVSDTLKRVTSGSGVIDATVERACLWRAQTPQVFRRAALMAAHQEVPRDCAVTDDAQLLELAGIGPVIVAQGEADNVKITSPDDLRLAEALLLLDNAAVERGDSSR